MVDWYIRVRLEKVFLLCLFLFTSLNVNSKDKEIIPILQCLTDLKAAPVEFSSFPEQSIFLFKTDKCCIPCYSDMEKIFKKNYRGYKVYVIIIMPEELLQMNAQVQTIKKYYKKADGFYFLFYEDEHLSLCDETNEIDAHLLKTIFDSPSPFYLIKNKKHFTLIDSDSTIKQMEDMQK